MVAVFPSFHGKLQCPLSSLCRRYSQLCRNIIVHGFRSAMSYSIAEQTDFNAETAETVLAHTVGTAVERAYRRSDLMEKRRRLNRSIFVTFIIWHVIHILSFTKS